MHFENTRLLHATPWHQTELGPREQWPAAMRAVVDAVLASAFPICTAWGAGGVQIYNDAYNAIFGAKHPHAFGRTIAESWPEIWGFLAPALEQVRATREPLWFKGALLPLAKQGKPQECYFDFSYSPLLDDRGEVAGFMSVAVEKTAEAVMLRRQGVHALSVESVGGPSPQAIQAALRALLEDNPMDAAMAVLYDADPNTGLPAGALWRLRCDRRMDIELCRLAGRHWTGELAPFPLEAGAEAHADYGHAIPIATGSGRVLGALVLVPHPLVPPASHHDFASQLASRLSAALQYSQARAEEMGRLQDVAAERDALYRFLFAHMEDAAFYTATEAEPEADEFVLAANERACHMLGYSTQELKGMRRETLFFADDPALKAAVAVRSAAGSFLGELVFRRKDGTPLPVEVSSRLVSLRSGAVRSVSIVRDISQRLAREKQRAEQARLDSVVHLTGGIAHDFNNFLTVIMANLDTLEESLAPGSPQRELVGNALLGAEQAAALTQQLLAYAKQQTLQTRPLRIPAFIDEVLGLLRSALGDAKALHVAMPPDLPACELDAAQFTAALLNLVTNARDAGGEGVTVTISGRARRFEQPDRGPDGHCLPAGDYVTVTVEDSGRGIAAQALPRIFEPFYSTRAAEGGSGLGLPMVQGFARQSGGDVRVLSEWGRGARFELLFPALPQPGRVPA